MVWWLIMIYFCIGYLLFFFLVWLFFYLWWLLDPPKFEENPIFNYLKVHYKIVKIKNNVYYYKGLYITDEYIIHNGFKMQHFENKGFLFRYLRTI